MSEHELWNELGNLYFMSGAYQQAIHAYSRSIQLDRGFGRPYSNLALTYVQQAKYSEAVMLYRRSIDLLNEDREKAISWHRLGDVYRHLKDYPKAVASYQRADELDPEGKADFEQTGQLLYGSADIPAEVLEQMRQAEMDIVLETPIELPASTVDEGPAPVVPESAPGEWVTAQAEPEAPLRETDPVPNENWIESYLNEEANRHTVDQDEADPYFPDPASLDLTDWLPIPEPFDALPRDAAEIVRQDGQQEYIEETDEQAYFQIGEPVDFLAALPAAGNAKSAEQPQRTAPFVDRDIIVGPPAAGEIPPGELEQADVHYEPATSETQEEDPRPIIDSIVEADIAKFKRVVQLNPRNAFAWDTLGTLYKSIGSYKDAITAYQQAISIDSSRAFYYHHLGLVYAAEGRNEDAIGAFQKVIELDPDYSLAHATLGGYYRKMGLEELAQKHIGKAMRIIYDSENEYNRACLEAICGNVEQAIELLRIALMNKQTYVDWVLRDPDLDFIRGDPRFKKLISEYTR